MPVGNFTTANHSVVLLCHSDFTPTPANARTFTASDYASFWIALVISITTYYLAASLVDLGEQ